MMGLLALVVLVCNVGSLLAQCQVDIPDEERRDCHPWPEASQAACEARGCVWCPSNNEGYPWCFFNDKVCPSDIPESSRVDCLIEGGGKADCNAKGCIWCESSTAGIPWCFNDPLANQGGEYCPVTIPESERIDCHPEDDNFDLTRSKCLARGCYWCPSENQGVPWCVNPREHGYHIIRGPTETPQGITAEIKKLNYPSWFGQDFDEVTVDADFQTENRLRIRISDSHDHDRFEVPLEIESPPTPPGSTNYEVQFVEAPAFGIRVIRKSSGAAIFDTTMGGLELSDQFLQFSTRLNSANLYGFGEHEHHSLRHDMNWQVWPMWTRDYSVNTSVNLYGHQPFYMNVEQDGSTHGVLILNANAADVTTMPEPGLLYRTIGGVLDLYFFLGPEPDTVVQQYLQATGLPMMVPYWSLGFQLCRWGYEDLEDLKGAVSRMRQYDIPHDIQYGDIDYMYERRDFTLDEVKWGGLPDYVHELKSEGTRFVIILDPAIYNQDRTGGYPAFDRGHALDVWVKGPDRTTPEEGEVWPGPVYYPDYSNPVTEEWWTDECIRFKRDVLDYDGLWIDMNEPSNFIHGREGGCDSNKYNEPMFVPRIADDIETKTLCMDTWQTFGMHYNVHSLYGWSMAKQTLPAARAVEGGDKRGVVFSRSTFPGAGQWGQHWLGDNWSEWSNLRWSVIGSLEFNWFGFPYIGADICGFFGASTEEICTRWHQLGAFYSFARNHNHAGEPSLKGVANEQRFVVIQPQDPGLWESVAKVTRESLLIRYTLLPYLYDLMNDANQIGSTVLRPLFFEFITETVTLGNHDQFLWGPAFLISPVLDPGMTSVNAYFPDARWYSYYDGGEVSTRRGFQVVSAPWDFIPLHVRGGYILPTQQPANSTMWSRSNPMGVIVALDDSSSARGSLFWDDGEGLDTVGSGDYFAVNYLASAGRLSNSITNNGYSGASSLRIDDVRVFGDQRSISTVLVNGQPHFDWDQDVTTRSITIRNAGIPLTSSFTVDWS